MFGSIFLLVLVLSLVPLFLKGLKSLKINKENKQIKYDNRYSRSHNQKEELPYPKHWGWVITLPALIILTWIIFSIYVHYASNFWWYQEVGRTDVFWTLLIPKVKIFFASFVLLVIAFSAFTILQYRSIFGKKWSLLISVPTSFVVALVFGLWIASEWQAILMYQNHATMGLLDPLFNKDASYYLFTLPLFDNLLYIAKTLLFSALAFVATSFAVKAYDMTFEEIFKELPKSIWFIIALWCGLHVFDRQLSVYQLMYTDHGLFAGVNYVGEHIKAPIYHTEQIVFVIIGLIALLVPFFKKADKLFKVLSIITIATLFVGLFAPLTMTSFNVIWFIVVFIVAIILAIYLFVWGRKMHREILVMVNILISIVFVQFLVNEFIVPATVQSVYVKPNQQKIEAPYIANNIQFTKQAFCLTYKYLVEKIIPYSENLTKVFCCRIKVTLL